MPVTSIPLLDADALDGYIDFRSVPKHRFFGRNEVIDRFRRAVPFDYIMISGLDINRPYSRAEVSIDTDLPPAFIESYEADDLLEADPFIAAGSDARTVVIESDVYKDQPPPRLMYLLQTFGIHNRTLVPIYHNDVVYGSVTFTRSTPLTTEEISFLTLVSELIHTTVTRPLMERFAAEQIGLSEGELMCLAAASRGLTSEAIAVETGFQTETVNTYIKMSIRKLGAMNRTQAIADALRRRLIA
jgi:DNA-binding CsgD family transcriptional regulator